MLYYTAPEDKIFNEIKEKAIEIWNTYDNAGGYRDSKVNAIKDLENISDNCMYIVAMFDDSNQGKLANSLSQEARLVIRERMIDGGAPDWSVKF